MALNRFLPLCLAALLLHVPLAGHAAEPPPLPPLADPPSQLQLTGKFVWADLFAEDAAKARQFYSKLLGWTWRTISSGADAYHLAENGGVPIAGLVQRARQPGEVAGGIWIAYVSVPDALLPAPASNTSKRQAADPGTHAVNPVSATPRDATLSRWCAMNL